MTTSPKSEHVQKIFNGALWYAKNGWKVLPCYGINDSGRCTCNGAHTEPKDVGKHPAIGEWQLRSTDDVTAVTDWWTTNPDRNIGVNCKPSGFLVIDIDPRSGGIESFEKFEELVGALPETVEALTGEYNHNGKPVRGRHLYYRLSQTSNC